ncbi:MAG: hypothetical protein NZ750_12480 [Anaerolineae bacterium]|nr:hypothetical protein [Anaerolineae bacterium]MDW8171277.1 hypothetical protein [Anaerolineae bacterium]
MSECYRGVPLAVYQRMYEVLAQALEQVLPSGIAPEMVIRKHVWYNSKYVGIASGQVQAWFGWRANMRPFNDDWRTLYIDYVPNKLPREERMRLFGQEFTQKIDGMGSFVFFFTTSFPFSRRQKVLDQGLTFRRIDDVVHPGVLMDACQFLDIQLALLSNIGSVLLQLRAS